jgi:hypothetical protein
MKIEPVSTWIPNFLATTRAPKREGSIDNPIASTSNLSTAKIPKIETPNMGASIPKGRNLKPTVNLDDSSSDDDDTELRPRPISRPYRDYPHEGKAPAPVNQPQAPTLNRASIQPPRTPAQKQKVPLYRAILPPSPKNVIPPSITPANITIIDDDSNEKWAKMLEEMLGSPKTTTNKIDVSLDLELSTSSSSSSSTTSVTSTSDTSNTSSSSFEFDQPGPSSTSHGLTLTPQERDLKILEGVQTEVKDEWSAITKLCVLLNSDMNTIMSLQHKVDLSYLHSTLKRTHDHLRDELAPFLLYHKVDEAPLYFNDKAPNKKD